MAACFDAQTMADTFNALRSNDLIWNYVVDNYYIGKQPPPFDLLYWNADQTRMPKALHLYYLRRFYRDNALAEGKLTLDGRKLSLKDVTIPIFMQSSKEDHIAPALSVYRSAAGVRRAGRVHRRRLGPHRRRHQPPGGEQISALDQQEYEGRAGGLVRLRARTPRLVVALLGRVAARTLRRGGPRAHAGRGQAQAAVRRAGRICEGAVSARLRYGRGALEPMPFSLYDITVPSFRQTLGAVAGLLDKAEAHCAEKSVAAVGAHRGAPVRRHVPVQLPGEIDGGAFRRRA